MQNFCILLAFLLITIALLIAVSIYCYLIKCRTKQKHYHFITQIMNREKFYVSKCIIKMSNEVKDMDMKKRTYYFVNDIINIKNSDPNNIKIDEKSYKSILVFYIGYVTIKDLKYVKINSVSHLYLIFSKVNRYFEEFNKSNYVTLVPTNGSKEKIKKYGEVWHKIRNLIRSITENSDDYNEKYMKIKFNSITSK